MRCSAVLALVSSLALVSAHGPANTNDAKVVTGNPEGMSYAASFPATAKVQGSVKVSAGTAGTGVKYTVSFSGIPATGGPFMYHVHEKAVPSDGDCKGTGAHLDPTKRGESPPCDSSEKMECQVGDLSGKWGNVTAGPTFTKTFTDRYSALIPGNPAYILDKSIVFHTSDKTRIGCANFTMVM